MLAQIFATFGLAVFLRSGAQFLWTPDFRLVQNPWIRGRFSLFGLFVGAPQLAAALAALLAFGLLYWFVTRTETGLALQATAQDRQAAALMGIDTERMFALGWGLGAACVGAAGALLANFFYVFPDVGAVFALLAYVTVALGGFGNVAATLFGGRPDRPGREPRRALGAGVQVRRRLLLLPPGGPLAPPGPLRPVLTPVRRPGPARAPGRARRWRWSPSPGSSSSPTRAT